MVCKGSGCGSSETSSYVIDCKQLYETEVRMQLSSLYIKQLVHDEWFNRQHLHIIKSFETANQIFIIRCPFNSIITPTMQ